METYLFLSCSEQYSMEYGYQQQLHNQRSHFRYE